MVVSLYTSRIVLATLGISDYGIYNVVGGIVIMLSFLNGAMSSATQRYLTFELGKGNFQGFSLYLALQYKYMYYCLYVLFFWQKQ